MTKIHIAVACHKPSRLPENELLVPIQVGAKLAKTRLPFGGDDTGDNISEKNPEYCELTAQYWEWKNVEADYYGLCHYRRFLCCHRVEAERNEREQIVANVLDDFTLEKFGLENVEEMRAFIESADAVVGEPQNLANIHTPRGNKVTAYAHWAAHERALIEVKDLEKMLKILEEVDPELGASARKYLKGNTFLGFNCFVMKKELFSELCKVEFEVLRRLEQEVDLTDYCQQLSRIYGFMGEIISSAYFYQLEQSGKYKVKHVPLLYFNYTDAEEPPRPLQAAKTIPVIFHQADAPAFHFGTIWQTFLNHAEKEYTYDTIVILSQASKITKNLLAEMAESYDNVKVRFIDEEYLCGKVQDRVETEVFNSMAFLPLLLPEFKKALVFGPKILFMDKVSELWQTELDGNLIAAPLDIYTVALANDIYVETALERLRKYLKNPLEIYAVNASLWDFEKYREELDWQKIAKSFGRFKKEKKHKSDEPQIVINTLCDGKIKRVDQKWWTWYPLSDHLEYQLPYAPLKDYEKLLAAQENPAVMAYERDDPWFPKDNELYRPYWTAARQTPFYEEYLAYFGDRRTVEKKKERKSFVDRMIPADTPTRGYISKIFPHDSRRYKVVKRGLTKLHLSK
ncbi:DUF4422 domain-containing protein [Candidatus Saccharibacteria bacterium]|nr:DUF4422 domain-containing protein [Candidatus Saccharibacteria bacterium]